VKHRLLNDGRSPIPMAGVADYVCVCGRRGTRDAVERHVAEMQGLADGDDDDFGGGDTKAHYLPIEPRVPAPTGDMSPSPRPDTPEPLPPPPPTPPISRGACLICGDGAEMADLPEITAWSCGHWIRKRPRSIAESFQDMLRIAYQAGAASAASGEIFETWYQREVLQ
jgi:hypothetical protein